MKRCRSMVRKPSSADLAAIGQRHSDIAGLQQLLFLQGADESFGHFALLAKRHAEIERALGEVSGLAIGEERQLALFRKLRHIFFKAQHQLLYTGSSTRMKGKRRT